MSAPASSPIAPLLQSVSAAAQKADVFGSVALRHGMLVCEARDAAAPAEYRVFEDAGAVWVGLFTADRWLSQSIEQDLVHTGDKLEELMEEELADQGEPKPASALKFEHFRDDDRVFTFRVRTGLAGSEPGGADRATRWLLACEAMFARLGDMQGGDED